MKLIVLKEKLKNGINIVEKSVGKSLSLPMLNNILISTEKNFLNLSSTDLEMGINWWSLVKIEKEGKIAVPVKVLSNFINLLPDKPITLEIDNLNLKIQCGDYKTIIKGFNPDDFPIIPKITKNENVFIKNSLFCNGLAQVVDIVNHSSSKPEVSGVYFFFQKNQIILAATDNFRLGEKKIILDSAPSRLSQEYSFILPQKTAREIINIFSQKEGNLGIYFSPNQVLFETTLPEISHPETQLISRLIEGEYPNYQEIIPKKHETKAVLQVKELINQIKLASLFSGKINEIKLKINPQSGRLDILTQNQDVGEHQSFLNGKIEGSACEVSFNYRFLLDGLLNITSGSEKTTEVVLGLSGSEKPGVIKPKGDDSYLYLVMPIKAD